MENLRYKIQRHGSNLSSMVVPNLGAFIAWGLLTAIGVATQNPLFQEFIGPMLNYLLPILIGFSGGKMLHGHRGGVVGTIATMGVIVGADIPMFIGAMIMGPLGGWVIKKFDSLVDGKVRTGFELLVNNFSAGILGCGLALTGSLVIGPLIQGFTGILTLGVNSLVSKGLLPLTSIFIEPAKVLFLNNAIGQGILSPIASTQVASQGKSILYLLESNPGPGLGVLLAFMLFGKGESKASAYGASLIHFIGGIHEIYFPFILMKPSLLLAVILGGITGVSILTVLNAGLVSVASPGSVITIMFMTAKGDHLSVLLGIGGASLVSFLVASIILKSDKGTGEDTEKSLRQAASEMEEIKGKESRVSSVFKENSENNTENKEKTLDMVRPEDIKRIAYACDAGLGSSAMGAAILKKKVKEVGREDIEIFHIAVNDLPAKANIVVTHGALLDRVKQKEPNAVHLTVTDFLNSPVYDEIAKAVKK